MEIKFKKILLNKFGLNTICCVILEIGYFWLHAIFFTYLKLIKFKMNDFKLFLILL